MARTTGQEPTFVIGGRYANRIGEYEVLNIQGDRMQIRYDNGTEQQVSVTIQARIANNMAIQAMIVAPYPSTLKHQNDLFFFTLGFLAVRATMLEAIVPPHALGGFVNDYLRVEGVRPVHGQSGFYVHRIGADKWGCELRVTFRATHLELVRLDFGPDVHAVDDPANPRISWRINNNGYWWRLLRFGFAMGVNQNATSIGGRIPLQYRNQFDQGCSYAS